MGANAPPKSAGPWGEPMEGDEPAAAWTDWDEHLEEDPDRYSGSFIRGSIPGSFRGWDGGDMEVEQVRMQEGTDVPFENRVMQMQPEYWQEQDAAGIRRHRTPRHRRAF